MASRAAHFGSGAPPPPSVPPPPGPVPGPTPRLPCRCCCRPCRCPCCPCCCCWWRIELEHTLARTAASALEGPVTLARRSAGCTGKAGGGGGGVWLCACVGACSGRAGAPPHTHTPASSPLPISAPADAPPLPPPPGPRLSRRLASYARMRSAAERGGARSAYGAGGGGGDHRPLSGSEGGGVAWGEGGGPPGSIAHLLGLPERPGRRGDGARRRARGCQAWWMPPA